MVTGLFRDRNSAERAYGTLTGRGYGKDDVSLLMSDETRTRDFPKGAPVPSELGTKAVEGAATGAGALTGGTIGGLLAA